ncbi:MAG: hypothetical protein ABSG43_09800 [Solirubrobacteraceae bacterium]
MTQQVIANRGPIARRIERLRTGGEPVVRKGAALTLSIKAQTGLSEGLNGWSRVDRPA